jgi:hypothetical protein
MHSRPARIAAAGLGLGVFLFHAVLSGGPAMADAPIARQLTPNVFVDEIEPSLDFWKKLGFEVSMEVPGPDGKTLGFVALANGSAELMLQSRISVAEDLPDFAMGGDAREGYAFYLQMETPIAELLPLFTEDEIVVPERHTFYGADELGVRSPEGLVVILAHFAEEGGE